MLTRSEKNGALTVTQQQTSPVVYLDHWALLDFSEDTALSSRFAGALKMRGGTLAISWANLIEFSKITNSNQVHKVENLLDSILPNIFFLETDPFKVIERENRLLAGGPLIPPHGDQDFLKVFEQATHSLRNPFAARNFISTVQKPEIADRMSHLGDVFVERIENMRQEVTSNEKLARKLLRPARVTPIQSGTRDILREIGRALLLDKRTRITRNHGIDFYHAVVSSSYCDLVLLDKYWATLVTRVRRRFDDVGLPVQIASVFSKADNGTDKFLHELETKIYRFAP
jgi:hypothetical protein